jgi:hypothetical protein
MQRREFVILLGAAAAWPIVANAQQQEGMRRIGMLTGITGEDVQTKARIAAFLQELQKLGWTEGRNFRMDIRAGAGNLATIRKYAAELVALAPDVKSSAVLCLSHYYLKQPIRCRSYSLSSSTRWVPVLSISCRDPAVT